MILLSVEARHAEAGIVGEDAEILVERGDVDHGRADGAGAHGQLATCVAGSIDELEFFVGHSGEAFGKEVGRRHPSSAIVGHDGHDGPTTGMGSRVTWSARRIKALHLGVVAARPPVAYRRVEPHERRYWMTFR